MKTWTSIRPCTGSVTPNCNACTELQPQYHPQQPGGGLCPGAITGHDGNTENNARQVVSNNTEIRADGRGIRSLCQPDFLARYGLKPIPLDEMGPHGNPWIK
ncbi:MAG: hypothetical protein ACLR8Y_22950 [Alistipes indistinctus]